MARRRGRVKLDSAVVPTDRAPRRAEPGGTIDRLRRRDFISILATASLAPLAARAQQTGELKRIGVLIPFAAGDAEAHSQIAAFLEALRQYGWIEGRSLRIDYRWAGGNGARIKSSRPGAGRITSRRDPRSHDPGDHGARAGDPDRSDRFRRGLGSRRGTALSQVSRARAVMSPGSRTSRPRWVVNGFSS